MLPILLSVLGGAAVLELRKLVTKSPDQNLLDLQKREEKLQKLVQEVQQQLQQERAEHSRDSSRVEELSKAAEELNELQSKLQEEAEALKQENAALTSKTEELASRQQVLEACASNLRVENGELQEEVKVLKALSMEDSAKYAKLLEGVRRDVSKALDMFASRAITAQSLVSMLKGMGVEVAFQAEALEAAPEMGALQDTVPRKVPQLELNTDKNWSHQLRLLADSPERRARLLAESAARSSQASTSVPSLTFPVVKTPPKEGTAARTSNWTSKSLGGMPALTMGAFTPRAGAQQPQNALSAAAQSPAPSPLKAQPPAEAPKSARSDKENAVASNKSMLFLPLKKVPANKKPSTPRFGVEVAINDKRNSGRAALSSFAFDNDADDFPTASRDLART
ncbi:hypothetical protein WJX72_002860 [[Myrmecia] bisecta]|uniref:Uncharacterized protein n=1 Tax=[Myrmecia] bisecta TaxID=41462 RepID=A0AAW1PE81_9CHLO